MFSGANFFFDYFFKYCSVCPKKFDELLCLMTSGGLEICVSSTSFQKSNIDQGQLSKSELIQI